MNNITLIDVIDWINWDEIINQLSNQEGVLATQWDVTKPKYKDIYKLWTDSNFNPMSIEWINYYPETHYSSTVVDRISNWLHIKPVRSWISRINPGYFAPWHWDVDDNEDEYLKNGDLYRYSCFIDNTPHGHIFMIGNEYITNPIQGSMYKWSDYREWHSGINAGITPKYMFHILGNKDVRF